MISIRSVTKTYGKVKAVNNLTFDVAPGRVTGFLGPNGAGKSTTLRMLVGLETPTSGSIKIRGRRYDELARPMAEIGALLDARIAHPSRSARGHLRMVAAAAGISHARVEEVLDMVGLTSAASRRTGGYSLGMKQRLGVACALLGDPAAIVLDEPVNGLDPEGVLWIRNTVRALAAEGRAVLLSSHLMSEMALTADYLVVIGRGQIVAEGTLDDVVSSSGAPSLEEAFLLLTRDSAEYTTSEVAR